MTDKKPRIVFPFVEAGLGHIMPMSAIADEFETKYGDRVDVVRTVFFSDTGEQPLKNVEQAFIDEVMLHHKRKSRGILENIAMHLVSTRFTLSYLFKKRFKDAYIPAMRYMQKLDADIIFSTHLSTHFYACEAKRKGYSQAKVVGYCPDPIIGLQWDRRVNLAVVSSSLGVKKALKSRRYRKDQVFQIPFLLRKEVESYDKGRSYYRKQLGLPENNFTILLADGAYGAGKLRETVYQLLKNAKMPLTIVAVCGKNETLYNEFCKIEAPEHIHFAPYGFTDKTLMLSAACDLFMGKAGASNLAEPIYFGAPCIVTFLATFVERWICNHHVDNGCAVKVTNVKKAVDLALTFAADTSKMTPYISACKRQSRSFGASVMADKLYSELRARETAAFSSEPKIITDGLNF